MDKIRQYTKGLGGKKSTMPIDRPTRYLKRKDGAILKAYDHSDSSRIGLIKIN